MYCKRVFQNWNPYTVATMVWYFSPDGEWLLISNSQRVMSFVISRLLNIPQQCYPQNYIPRSFGRTHSHAQTVYWRNGKLTKCPVIAELKQVFQRRLTQHLVMAIIIDLKRIWNLRQCLLSSPLGVIFRVGQNVDDFTKHVIRLCIWIQSTHNSTSCHVGDLFTSSL